MVGVVRGTEAVLAQALTQRVKPVLHLGNLDQALEQVRGEEEGRGGGGGGDKGEGEG